jgi:hypothetical protein
LISLKTKKQNFHPKNNNKMKNLILLFMVCIFAGQTQAQTPPFYNFAPTGAKWHYTGSDAFGAVTYFTVESIRSEVFQGETAQVLEVIEQGYYFVTNQPYNYVRGTERVYSDSGKIYHWSNNQWVMLYDFASPVGTQWNIRATTISGPNPSPCSASIDGRIYKTKDTTEIINGVSYRRFETDTVAGFGMYNLQGKTLEKLGNFDFLFPQYTLGCNVADVERINGLRCYSENSQPIYQNIKCDSLRGVGIEEPNNYWKAKVINNPISDILQVQLPKTEVNLLVNLFNIQGKKVSEYQFQNQDVLNIDTKHLVSGYYMLQIKSPKYTQYFKIIKQ